VSHRRTPRASTTSGSSTTRPWGSTGTVYLTQNFFGTEFDVTIVTLDKAAMYAGEEVTAHHFDRMSDPDADGVTFTVQPAQQPSSGGSDGTFYLVNSDFPIPFPGPAGTLTLRELTDPLDGPSLECFTLAEDEGVDKYSYPLPARQPESSSQIDTLGTRLTNADYTTARCGRPTRRPFLVRTAGRSRPLGGTISTLRPGVSSRAVRSAPPNGRRSCRPSEPTTARPSSRTT
jgi:hypothetical protein